MDLSQRCCELGGFNWNESIRLEVELVRLTLFAHLMRLAPNPRLLPALLWGFAMNRDYHMTGPTNMTAAYWSLQAQQTISKDMVISRLKFATYLLSQAKKKKRKAKKGVPSNDFTIVFQVGSAGPSQLLSPLSIHRLCLLHHQKR